MKEIYEEAKLSLKKSQEEMKKNMDRNRKKVVEYKVKDCYNLKPSVQSKKETYTALV